MAQNDGKFERALEDRWWPGTAWWRMETDQAAETACGHSAIYTLGDSSHHLRLRGQTVLDWFSV